MVNLGSTGVCDAGFGRMMGGGIASATAARMQAMISLYALTIHKLSNFNSLESA
jgi:hypothetical protein